MRLRSIFAILGCFCLAAALQGQSILEHAAAAAGATAGAAAGKPVSNAITKIFGNVSKDSEQAAKTKDPAKKTADVKAVEKEQPVDPQSQPNPIDHPDVIRTGRRHTDGAAASLPDPGPVSAPPAQRRVAAEYPLVATVSRPVMQGPPMKDVTPEEFASIKVGDTSKEMIAVLGAPASRVIIPDDDGHLRETCQYWSRGKELGVIRLDNGQVAKVEVVSQ